MPQHIPLPSPIAVGSRRAQPSGGSAQPPGNRQRHGAALKEQLSNAVAGEPAAASRASGIDPRRVFKVAANNRISDSDFRNKGLTLLGETLDWGYFVLPADEAAQEFEEAIARYAETEEGRSFFDVVDHILPYTADDRRGPGLLPDDPPAEPPILLDIHLWPADDTADANVRLDQVRAVVGQAELGADEQPAFLVIRARLEQRDLLDVLELPFVRLVRVPPSPYLSPADWTGSLDTHVVQPAKRDGCVGIIDDGVMLGHALLDGLVDAFEVPSGRVWAAPTRHGTMVAGLAAYGDFEAGLRDGGALPAPLRVIAARVVEPIGDATYAVFPSDSPEHLVYEEAVRGLAQRGARVINISISDRYSFSGPHLDERTELLDSLARELDLVIVVAAGNTVDLPDGAELHRLHPDHLLTDTCRIAEPAIGANLITVGSISRSEQGASSDGTSAPEIRAVAAVDQVSPFSRSGPGFHPNGSIKPDLVHYGGNLVTQAMLSNRSTLRENPGVGVVSLSVPGPYSSGSGTSYAAPRVARIAAVVRAEYPDASANLTRALVGLSARVPEPHKLAKNASAEDLSRSLRLVGYGIPSEQRAVESGRNRAVLTFDGEIEPDTSVIHPIPVPEVFCLGTADRSISVALAYDPPARRFRREYLAARMKVDLYRATDIDELRSVMARQPNDSRLDLWRDRRRVQDRLRPSVEAVGRSTLQVRRWHAASARSLDPDDGPFYYLVVTHTMEPWAERFEPDYDRQTYALAIELEDRTRTDLDVFNHVRSQLQPRIRPTVIGQATLDFGSSARETAEGNESPRLLGGPVAHRRG